MYTPAYARKTLRPIRAKAINCNIPAYAGRPERIAVQENGRRNTPAYAGKTAYDENDPWEFLETPPLTRGRLVQNRQPRARIGNTPAYAGKTGTTTSAGSHTQKHPRLRGEDGTGTTGPFTFPETPPLTRGRPSIVKAFGPGVGNTPAYAGKTRLDPTARSACPKHPHLRGEDDPYESCAGSHPETPPLTRGRHPL